MLLKEAADRLWTLKDRRRTARRRATTKNLLLGATVGTAAGAAAGLLLAPQSGKRTREKISQRTGQTLDTIKARVSSAGEQVNYRTSRLREAAEACSENLKAAVTESVEEEATKGKKKK